MDLLERNNLKQLITLEITKTQEKLKVLVELCQPIAPENAIGRISRMDAINNKAINEAALHKTEQKLSLLTRALAKINDKDFGLCKRCGEAIPPRRLLLMPQSTFCVPCAQNNQA